MADPMYDREHEVIENRVDDLNVSAHLGGLTIRLEDDGPEDKWASLDVSWETLSEWYARLHKARPGAEDPAIAEAIRIHDDHKAALGGTYDTCRSPSCWAAGKILAATKGVNLGQPQRVRAARPRRTRAK